MAPLNLTYLGLASVAASSAVAGFAYRTVQTHYEDLESVVVQQDVQTALKLARRVARSTSDLLKTAGTRLYQHVQSPTVPSLEGVLKVNPDNFETIINMSVGVAAFRLLGGRFRSVLPSSLFHPGAFSRVRASLPANGAEYITKGEREGSRGRLGLNDYGWMYGCHSCGRKRVDSFIGDHMPPNKLAKPGQLQRLYPQCPACSSKQGGAVRANRPAYRTHPFSLRLYHVWLPLGPWLYSWLCGRETQGGK